ncbi:MAG: shikimate kinase [Rhodococcus sp. (in: high G+C Gram-positive bacteria)]|uniref:shikimate kinase n=1 Tax=Rhodococcus sp. TaxID=1831 RepID=UPI003BAFAA89
MPPRAVLVGPPGAGKSTIGRRLAQALDVPLFDTDAAIEEETGRTIPEIFREDGEPAFRAIEEDVVRKAIENSDGIVSLGGGSILSERTRELLKGQKVIYLEISVAEGLKRTGTNTGRPLLAGSDPRKKYTELMRRRRPLYRQVATIRIRTDGRSPARVVQQLVEKLAQ